MIAFDDGIITIYELQNTAQAGAMPAPKLVQKSQSYYQERTISYNRQYLAMGINEQIDMLCRIWQDRAVKIGYYAIVDNEQYRITNVAHMLDNSNLRVTEITLQRLEHNYDVED